MSSARRKKDDDKPPPALGPGSVIKALAAPLRRHLPRDENGVFISFSTAGMKALPLEVSSAPFGLNSNKCYFIVVIVTVNLLSGDGKL